MQFICHSSTLLKKTMNGGAKVLQSGEMLLQQDPDTEDITNLDAPKIWVFMIYVYLSLE